MQAEAPGTEQDATVKTLFDAYVTRGERLCDAAREAGVTIGEAEDMLRSSGVQIRRGIADVASPPWLRSQREAGRSVHDIAASLGCGVDTVWALMIRCGIARPEDKVAEAMRSPLLAHLRCYLRGEPTSRSVNRIEVDSAALAHGYVVEGKNVEQLAAEFGIGKTTVAARLREYGVELRPRGPVPRRRAL